MKHFYALMVVIDEFDVVQLLQQKVTGIVENVAARMIASGLKESLKSNTVVQVFPGMDFVAYIYTGLIKTVKYGQPALGKRCKTGFHQPLGPLRPRVHGVP